MNPRLRGGLFAGGTAAGFGVATAAASVMLYRQTVPRPNGVNKSILKEFADEAKFEEYKVRMKPLMDWVNAQKMEEVFITSQDHLKLHAFYLPAEKPCGKLVLLHHGYSSNAMDNGTHVKFFHDLGYEVFLLDLRAHGKSEGNYVGFGILDRYDTLDWVNYVRKRFGDAIRIVLHGTSMGGATVLMALGLKTIQNNVSAVIADCAYTSPAEIFSDVMRYHYHVPVTEPVIRLTSRYSKAAAGYAFSDYSTTKALEHNEIPVLLIHGTEDKFVPVWMSQKNYDACHSRKKLLLVEHAGHGSSIFENMELYQKTELEFLNDVFQGQ